MDHLIFHNDCILPLEETPLSPGQMGLLTGWGVFTTLRLYRTYPFAFHLHWARMERDAARLAMTLHYPQAAVRQAVIKLAEANQRPEAMARVYFIKNRGGLWAQAPDRPPTDLLVFTRELVTWPTAHRLKLQPDVVLSVSHLAGAKMLSWVQYAALLERAHEEGFDDALLSNEKEHLVECTSANIFLVRQGRILTPPLSSGCLPGVTREVLRGVLPGAGFELHEEELSPADLGAAEEVFITSTTREVAGVGSISPHWNYPAPGKVTRVLQEAFRAYVKSHLPPAPEVQS